MGGGTAILYTAENSCISQLVTWAATGAATTPWGKWDDNRMQHWKDTGVTYYTNSRTGQELPLYYQLYEDFQKHADRLDIPRAAKKITVPWLICHGTEDAAVAYEVAVQLHQIAPVSELFLMDSGHTFGRVHPWTAADFHRDTEILLAKSILYIKAHIR